MKQNEDIRTLETVVYDRDGHEIDRMAGHVEISPKDYDGQLPIEYRYIETTVRTLCGFKVER